MLHLALILIQAAAPATPDTIAPVYDSPATRALVERAILESGEIPTGLSDYEARVRSRIHGSMAADTARGGEAALVIDEMVSTVRWHRPDFLEQTVLGHRVSVRAAVPYTIGSLLTRPWVLPHLYGGTIDVFDLLAGQIAGTPAIVHPFGREGPDVYRYEAGDTVRIRAMGTQITVVPVRVRPRTETDRTTAVGTFYLDVDRAAVARARFMAREPRRRGQAVDLSSFFEVENSLWDGRFWLPFRQRIELHIGSRLLGGTIAARIVNDFAMLDPNTGWEPDFTERPVRLIWDQIESEEAFADWSPRAGDDAAEFDIGDWDDLRRAAEFDPEATPGGLRLGLAVDRTDHVFRYNRVEGFFLGLGARLEPADPAERSWDVYGTGGWAFAEGTPRGEVQAGWRSVPAIRVEPDRPVWFARAAAYRRLPDTRTFLPTLQWDLIHSLSAGVGGFDPRDYYDAAGAELRVGRRLGPTSASLALRSEQHEPVERNTQRFLFGTTEDFEPVAPADPGRHTALEGELRYARGAGSFGLGRTTIASLAGTVGLGDFGYQELSGLLSARQPLGPFTLAGRLDAVHQWGDPPPQALARFGEAEGLAGYPPNAFGGTTAILGRARFLVPLPPRTQRPLFHRDIWIIPPLRPHLVLIGEGGWSDVRDGVRPTLDRIGAVATTDPDGPDIRGSYGVGVSIFDDVLTLEYLWPTDEARSARLRFGFVEWF